MFGVGTRTVGDYLILDVVVALLLGLTVSLKQFLDCIGTISKNTYVLDSIARVVSLNLNTAFMQWGIMSLGMLIVLLGATPIFLVIRMWAFPASAFGLNPRRLLSLLVRIIVYVMILAAGGYALNIYLLSGWFNPTGTPVNILTNGMFLLFMVFLAWCLIKRVRKAVVLIGTVVSIVIIGGLASVKPAPPDHRAMEKRLQAVRSLPYVAWGPEEEEETIELKNVVEYKRDRAYEGINLYSSINRNDAFIMDMEGNTVHTFTDKRARTEGDWVLIEPYYDSDFVVLVEDKTIMMIDWDSNVKWESIDFYHHDFAIAGNGDIYVIANRKKYAPRVSWLEPFIDNVFVVFSPDGNIKRRISLWGAIRKDRALLEDVRNQIRKKYHYGRDALDLLHANAVEVVSRDVFSEDERLFKRGDILFCLKHPSFIGVMDIDKEKIVWTWGVGDLEYPHHPSLLENGNILIFDNGYEREYSRVIELDPCTETIVWEYRGDPSGTFYTEERGGAQRLPNGNTLIVESNKGHAFEVTEDGEIVWGFLNPEIKEGEKRRAPIYRMLRLPYWESYPAPM